MKALWGLALGNFAVGTGALTIAGVLPELAQDAGVSDATSGHLVTVYAITYAVAAPVLGSLTGRMDRRLLLVLAASLIAASNAIGALSTDFTLLMAVRVTAAIGALASTVFGAFSRSTKPAPAPQPQQYNQGYQQQQQQQSQIDLAYQERAERIGEYNRAFGACMAARDYTIN